jgi:hypothetical protein
MKHSRTSFAKVVMKTSGRVVDINVRACRADLCESAALDSGNPFENEAT